MANVVLTPTTIDPAPAPQTEPIIRTTRGTIPGGAKGAAKYAGGGLTWWYSLIARGLMPPPIKAGRRSLWKYDDVDAALARLAANGRPA